MNRLLFLLSFLFSVTWCLPAQTFNSRYLSHADGLASSRAYMSIEDPEGFVWIATAGGVNRYDGNNLEAYDLRKIEGVRQRPNLISLLAIDLFGNLWLALSSGTLLKYEASKNTFVFHDQIANENDVPLNITNFTIGRDGVFLFGTFQAAFAYAPATREMDRLSEINTTVKAIVQSENGTWFIGSKDGVAIYNEDLEFQFNLKQRVPADTWLPGEQRIDAMYLQEEDQKLWIGSQKSGLYYYDLKHDELLKVDGPLGRIELHIKSIVEYTTGKLMVGTDGGGIFLFDTFSGKVEKQLTNRGGEDQALNSNAVYHLMISQQGIVFVSTFRGGVNILNPKVQPFLGLRHQRGVENSLKNNVVYSIREIRPGIVSFGTNRGLSLYDKKNRNWEHLSLSSTTGETKSEVAWSQTIDQQGNLLVASFIYPLRRFQYDDSGFKLDPSHQLPEISGQVKYLHTHEDGTLLIGTINAGLFTYKAGVTDKNYPFQSCFDVVRYSLDKLIVGHRDGLSWLDLSHRESAPITDPLVKETLRGKALNSLLIDQKRRLWVGTVGHGIFVFEPGFTGVRQINDTTGLAANLIIDLVDDMDGNIWVATAAGISVVSEDAVANYYESDGLISTEYNRNAAIRDLDGRLYFGSNHGVITFDPREVNPAQISKKLVFTDFYLNHKRIAFGEEDDVLRLPLRQTEEINLAHDQNSFSIGFTNIDFVHPDRGEYRWQLEGFDDKWIVIDEQNRATYTNLNPGEYTFRLRLTDPRGNLLTDEKTLRLTIQKSWWTTGWAYLGYLLLTAGLLWLLFRFNRLRIESDSARERLHFLIELAHEIKTPLTLIKAPITDFLNNSETDEQTRESLGVALDSAELLQKQMRQFLDFQIVQLRKNQPEFEVVDLVELIKGKVRAFDVLAGKKRIDLHFNPDSSALLVLSDENIVDKIIGNLLSNAIKYTPEGGEIKLSLSSVNGRSEIRVRDNGIGIPKELQKKIFTLFYRTDNARASGSTGSGVGLVLARDLAETLGGEVQLTNSDERGSEFVLSLPLPAEPLTASLKEKAPYHISGLPPTVEGSTGLSLLIVEDNQALRTYQKKRFGGKFSVLTAANGEEALDLIGDNPPDVIISDVVMPKMNGYQLCLQLKSNVATSHIPFFLLTGQDSREHIREGFASGADDYITKPVDFDILSAKIDNLLLTRAAFQKTFSEAEEGAVFQQLSNELDQQFLDDITKLVEDNISDAELSVNFLCQSVGMSRTPFYHKLKTLIDLSPSEFIRTIRLKRARQMLLRPGINISEVAYSTGFSDAKYFSTLFKKNFAVSPSGFIADQLKDEK